jgi:hypothetical protein
MDILAITTAKTQAAGKSWTRGLWCQDGSDWRHYDQTEWNGSERNINHEKDGLPSV